MREGFWEVSLEIILDILSRTFLWNIEMALWSEDLDPPFEAPKSLFAPVINGRIASIQFLINFAEV